MRNAALVLGIIGGLVGMFVGFFSYGYTEFIAWFGDVPEVAEQVDNVRLILAAFNIDRYGPIFAFRLM